MLAQERFEAIAALVSRRQKLSLQELQGALGVSPATLRRDLTELETQGKIVRVHGAVVHPGYFRGEPSFAQKRRSAAGVKRAIAKVAADLVPPKATVWVDAGTTCLEVGTLLLARRDLTIWTHSIPLAARALESGEGAKVVMVGGEVRVLSGAAVGALGLSWLEKVRADWCFLGASGLSFEGASTTEVSEANMKSAILARCQTKVLLCDARKWENPVALTFAAWKEFDFWVTNADFDPKAAQKIEKQGPHVVRAEIS